MIEFQNGSGDVLAPYKKLPNLSNRGDGGFYPEEKKYIDTDTSEEVINPNYDQSVEYEEKLRTLNIRSIRDQTLMATDSWMFEDAKSASDVVYTTAEKDTIKTFRQELKDWPDTLTTNAFSGIATPVVPAFLPRKDKAKVESILNGAKL